MKERLPLLALVIFIGMTSINWTPEDAPINPPEGPRSHITGPADYDFAQPGDYGIHLSDPAAVKQHGTVVTPVLDDAMLKGKNVLWCATMQMAWDGAAEKFGRPLKLQPHSKLADALNRKPFDRRWVDDGSMFAMHGSVDQGVLDQIKRGARKTGKRPSVLLDRIKKSMAPGDLVFFAMLHKELEFPQPFGKLGTYEVGDHKVPWFGFTPVAKESGALRQQVRVHHYAAKDDFVVELRCKQSGDQLVLAKLPAAPRTMADISQQMMKHLQANAPNAGYRDLLAVPHVAVDEQTTFPELHGKTVAGSGIFVREALQSIGFQMDEKGVKLHSEASITFGCSMQNPGPKPRMMVLDPPFAIVMMRKDAPQPYFVAWLANADLLRGE